jgi:hypothetical protein
MKTTEAAGISANLRRIKENLFIDKFVTYKVIPETVNANTSSSDTTDDAEDENAPLSDLISKKAIFAVLCEDTPYIVTHFDTVNYSLTGSQIT